MKKKEFLQDSIGLIDDDIVKEAKDEPRRKNTPWARLIAVAACVAILAAAVPVGFLIADRATPQIDGGQETENNSEKTDATVNTTPQFDENGREIWLDNRKYKEGLKPYGEELAYEWSWEYLDIYEKFWLIDVNNEPYYYVNKKIPEDLLGEHLGEMLAYGYDDFGDGGRYEIDCVAYSIKGAPDNDAIAVKLEGTDEFVVYSIFRYKFDPPKTFGEMIALKNLSENISFLNYYYDHDEDVWTAAKKYELSIEQSDHVWKIFTEKCADAEAIKYEDYHGSGQKISLVVSSDILPMNGLAIEVYAEGYIKTNIFLYGSCFFIGKSAANEIIEYVLTNPKEAPESTDKWVAGTITEIGEDYFKINDAPMMENEEDGIEFTVKTTDIKLLRYFKAGILKVGDTAIVKYNGNIYADDPTTIDSAYSLYECQIHSGDVYIPE